MANNNLTAQQRAQLFAASTRQHYQMIGTKEITGGAQTVEFTIPKARLLQAVRVYVSGVLNVKGAAAVDVSKTAIYKSIRQAVIDLNNGFRPIVLGGEQAALMSMLYPRPEMWLASADGATLAKCPAKLAASEGGSDNEFSFFLDLPLTTNERDMTGIVLAQNNETLINLSLDIANANAVVNNKAGYTCDFKSMKIKVMTVTYSIPSDSRCMPDMSILVIKDSRSDAITSGVNYVKLPTGMIYRKMLMKFENADGTPMTMDKIASNLEVVLNTADVPYSIDPVMLHEWNKLQTGIEMPEGVYFLSFDYQGQLGYGGARDLLDAERITELAIRFNATEAGKLTVVSEKLSRLVAG